jgi:hypothetical protein
MVAVEVYKARVTKRNVQYNFRHGDMRIDTVSIPKKSLPSPPPEIIFLEVTWRIPGSVDPKLDQHYSG